MAYLVIALTLLAASVTLPVHAQTAATHAPRINSADPADPKAAAPSVVYRSVFDAYRALGDDAMLPWREANDRVGAIGGWRVYAREAQQPTTRPASDERAPSAPQVAPAPGGQQHKH